MAVLELNSMQRKALSYDAVADLHRVAYEDGRRNRGVREDTMRWCLEAGKQEQVVLRRNEVQECYFCGAPVRLNGTIVNTLWQCPKRMDTDEDINH